MAFGPDGTLLALDLAANVTQLFDPRGNLVAEPDLAACEPGFDGQLSKGVFLGDGSFLVLPSGGVPAFRFDPDGTCAGRFDYGNYLPLYVAPLGDNLLTVRRLPPDMRLEERSADGELVRTLGLFPRFANLNGMIPGGGLHVAPDGRIYFGQTATMEYAVFDSAGREAGTIGEAPSYFRGIERDAESPSSAFAEYMGRISRQNSIRVRSFLLGGDKLVSLIDNGYETQSSDRRFGLVVLGIDGTVLTREAVFLPSSVTFVGALEDLLFRLVVPETLGEPYLVLYRFKDRS